jgi:hypothetical protein
MYTARTISAAAVAAFAREKKRPLLEMDDTT